MKERNVAKNLNFLHHKSVKRKQILLTIKGSQDKRNPIELTEAFSFVNLVYHNQRRLGMTKDKKNSVFMKPVQVSEVLTEIVGQGPMPRTEVTKKVWEYIKKHKLQDEKNKRMINPDNKLAKVLDSTQPIDMFKMTSKIAKHLKEPELSDSRKN